MNYGTYKLLSIFYDDIHIIVVQPLSVVKNIIILWYHIIMAQRILDENAEYLRNF